MRTGLGWAPFDDEGRYIEARFGNLSVVSFYIPSGSSGELRQGFKFEVMEWLEPILHHWLHSGRDYVLCGDWNIVRSELDIRNWKSNQKNSGCLPRERDWLNGLCADTTRLGRCLPRAACRRPGLHLVEQPRRCAREQRGVAHRLPVRARRRCATGCGPARSIPTPRFSDHAPFVVDYDLMTQAAGWRDRACATCASPKCW